MIYNEIAECGNCDEIHRGFFAWVDWAMTTGRHKKNIFRSRQLVVVLLTREWDRWTQVKFVIVWQVGKFWWRCPWRDRTKTIGNVIPVHFGEKIPSGSHRTPVVVEKLYVSHNLAIILTRVWSPDRLLASLDCSSRSKI